jgi:hypothetical protein
MALGVEKIMLNEHRGWLQPLRAH